MRYTILFSIIFLCLLVPFDILGQDENEQDFIELQSGEKLFGQIRVFSGKSKFQKVTLVKQGKLLNYSASDIKAFEYGNNQRYEFHEESGLLRQVLLLGELSLYKNSEAYFLINKDRKEFKLNDKVKELTTQGAKVRKKNSSWHRQLALATQDCLIDLKLVHFIKFKDESISSFIQSYNECKKSKVKTFNTDSNKVVTRIGLALGGHQLASSAAIRFQPQFTSPEGSSNAFEIGLSLEMFYKNSQEMFALTPEILFRQVSMIMTSSELINPVNNTQAHHDIYYSATTISVPIGVKLSLNRTYPRYYIKASAVPEYSISSELRGNKEIENFNNEIFLTETEIDNLPLFFMGYSAALGCQFNMGKLKANIEAQFGNAYTNEFNATYKITTQRIGLGFKVFF